jgi:membrane complex biogenesis BtpA family protein
VISDPEATIELAAAVDASFVRSVFTGAYAGEAGIRYPDIARILRRKRALGMDNLKMFYMINAESDGDLSGRDLSVVAQAVIFKCAPDGICISGIHAGHGVDSGLIASIKKVSAQTAVFCNTGCTAGNIAEKLQYSDGAFVGTAFKENGSFSQPVDERRVREFMKAVNEFRSSTKSL